MPSAVNSTLEFSHIRATEVSKYQELRIQITLDGIIQESLESTLDASVHTWREPFSFVANSVSLCEIHVLAKKRKFFCCTGRYKVIRTTRLQFYVTPVIRLPLYDSTKTDANGTAMGSVVFLIADTQLSTRDSVSCKDGSQFPYPEAVLEKLSLAESDSEAPTSPPPRPKAPSPPASPPSASPIHRPPNVLPQPPLPSPAVRTPQYLQTTARLPQSYFAYSPKKSGVDRIPAEMQTSGDAGVHPKYVLSPGILADGTITAASLLVDEDNMSGPGPQGSAEIGNFTPVICEPPEDIASEGSEAWSSVPLHMTEPTSLPTRSESYEHGTIPRISITLTKSSRGNSPLAPSSCGSEVTVKRPSVHVDTGSATQTTGVMSALSVSPGYVDESSPISRSAVLASPQPRTSTTNTSSSGLSPFSRTSMVESPSTARTTPAQSAISEASKDELKSALGSHAKQRKERPTIDTSCVGPRGQVRKYRNGSVPPVHVPVKLRNASLDLPRSHEYEKYEPNPSMYSIAPSLSPPHKKSGDLRCPSSQRPASRQGIASSTYAPSIRREHLEFDEAQICLDTANLGDQEVATFLKEVDAALSAVVNGSPAVAADSRAFLAVPSATSRLGSRHQSRRPSSQHLRADLSATVRSHEKEAAARTGFSLVATSHPSPHPDVIPSRAASPRDGVQRRFLSQVDVPPGSMPGSPSRGAIPASLPRRMSPQPSPRQELVEWVSPSFVTSVSTRTKEHLQLSRPGSYYGDVSGNETTSDVFKLEIPQGVRGRRA
ncbi:hypothetical protein JVT61DRAFT_3127 [Boletus reticuloceps]|uniref:Uncharacterized protein n=1 Tax=Boletus reticuloceps TaxID=495285 RepID=A0A8I2YRN8_9AGAM|nr:hypothetical protein JVT61DRAFT_3127 [Boletus reticuloceps]